MNMIGLEDKVTGEIIDFGENMGEILSRMSQHIRKIEATGVECDSNRFGFIKGIPSEDIPKIKTKQSAERIKALVEADELSQEQLLSSVEEIATNSIGQQILSLEGLEITQLQLFEKYNNAVCSLEEAIIEARELREQLDKLGLYEPMLEA